MIKPGTLCLLVRDHFHAGKVCTVTRYVPPGAGWIALGGRTVLPGDFYSVDIPGAAMPRVPGPLHVVGWAALRSHLVPLTPDADPIDERRTDDAPVAA